MGTRQRSDWPVCCFLFGFRGSNFSLVGNILRGHDLEMTLDDSVKKTLEHILTNGVFCMLSENVKVIGPYSCSSDGGFKFIPIPHLSSLNISLT